METIIDKTFEDVDFTKTPFQTAEYDNCHFKDCLFQDKHISNCTFLECRFSDCNLTNTQWGGTTFNSVEFENCKLLGSDLSGCNPFMLQLRFRESNLTLAICSALPLKGTSFLDCVLEQTDFTHADLKKVRFENCNLKNAIFDQTQLEGADFTKAINYEIDPTQNAIAGALFSRDGLEGILTTFGIKVID